MQYKPAPYDATKHKKEPAQAESAAPGAAEEEKDEGSESTTINFRVPLTMDQIIFIQTVEHKVQAHLERSWPTFKKYVKHGHEKMDWQDSICENTTQLRVRYDPGAKIQLWDPAAKNYRSASLDDWQPRMHALLSLRLVCVYAMKKKKTVECGVRWQLKAARLYPADGDDCQWVGSPRSQPDFDLPPPLDLGAPALKPQELQAPASAPSPSGPPPAASAQPMDTEQAQHGSKRKHLKEYDDLIKETEKAGAPAAANVVREARAIADAIVPSDSEDEEEERPAKRGGYPSLTLREGCASFPKNFANCQDPDCFYHRNGNKKAPKPDGPRSPANMAMPLSPTSAARKKQFIKPLHVYRSTAQDAPFI